MRVLIAMKPVDFRKGASGLAALVQAEIKADPFSGTVFDLTEFLNQAK